MSPTVQLVLVLGGLVLLVAGGELLVRGASALARRLSISPLVIGLTVVAFGTSAPELAVGIGSALRGQPDLAVGNVVGSNVFNVLVILGISALIVPLDVDRSVIRREVPILVGASLLVLLLSLDGEVGRLEGGLLFAGIVVYAAIQVRASRRTSAGTELSDRADPQRAPAGSLGVAAAIGAIGGGLVALTLGSDLLIRGATVVARGFGISELVIGLTLVAAGTSLPEVATSVVAALRGERDLAVGNVVGSNLFNLGAVLGGTALVAPDGVAVSPAALRFDLPVMVAVAVACLPIFFTGAKVDRWEGGLFLAYYGLYVLLLALDAVGIELPARNALAVVAFVVPLTVVTLAVLVRTGRPREPGDAGRS